SRGNRAHVGRVGPSGPPTRSSCAEAADRFEAARADRIDENLCVLPNQQVVEFPDRQDRKLQSAVTAGLLRILVDRFHELRRTGTLPFEDDRADAMGGSERL